MRRKRTQEPGDAPSATANAAPQRDHAQALYDRVIGWYEDAERKAQLILTLDGIFLSFISTSAFKRSADLRATTLHFGAATWVLLGMMGTALVASIVSAVVALRSRLYMQRRLNAEFGRLGVDTSSDTTYRPAVTWFFQYLANLEPEELGRALVRADADFAVRALSESVVPLAKNVVAKHRWVNRGFLFFGAVLVFFLAAAVSYVLRVS